VFGCKAWAHIPREKRRKLDSKTTECMFVGYSTTQKAYRLIETKTGQIISSRDVIFEESKAGRLQEQEDEEIELTDETEAGNDARNDLMMILLIYSENCQELTNRDQESVNWKTER
jgi:hypothetical protein